jgi:hypothetical protein
MRAQLIRLPRVGVVKPATLVRRLFSRRRWLILFYDPAPDKASYQLLLSVTKI